MRVLCALFLGIVPAFAALADQPGAGASGIYDVKSFGAKGDSTTLDNAAINRAIDTAAAAGGGTVRFPAGTYLSTSIHLKSNICLYIDQGATILAAAASEGVSFDPPEENPTAANYQDFGHTHFHNSLIWGEGLENISILGPGLIWGKGLTSSDKPKAGQGNKSICLKLCRNVTLRDVSILHGGHFGILATGVDNFTIDNMKFDTNRDGIDVDCCRNVRISNCSVNSPFDDGICLKSSFGLGFARATENVTITNCQVSGYDEGSFLDGTFKREKRYGKNKDAGPTGRIKFGTESNGGFKNVTISNCLFDYCRGLALETVDGGLLEDVTITNITMRDIVNAPIFLRLGARLRGPKESTVTGQLRRVILSDFVIYNADPKYGCIISGVPGHAIEDVKLTDIKIYYQGGGTKEQAALQPTEEENKYPEPLMFGDLPSYGFFVRHVKGLEMRDVDVRYAKDDARPAFVIDDVKGAEFIHVKAQHAEGAPIFSLKAVEDFIVDRCKGLADVRKEKVEAEKL